MKTLLATILLAAIAAPAAAGPDFVTPSPRPRALAASSGVRDIGPQDDILFAFDSHALTSAAQQQLASVAAWLKTHPRYQIVLEGYTDSSGFQVYNEDLATRRAAIARSHLISLGVPASRIVLVVYGEVAARAPLDPLSRRVVMYATEQSPAAVATASLDRKQALRAVWSERDNALFSEQRTKRPEVVSRR
ncbi:MAG TPA: OmpA family protein [Kofleriaceae bacterium]|nr:OmpA family protein [Kofleriaceae bacterium]